MRDLRLLATSASRRGLAHPAEVDLSEARSFNLRCSSGVCHDACKQSLLISGARTVNPGIIVGGWSHFSPEIHWWV